MQKTSAWSFDMEGHARKCVERYCEVENKKTEQLFKVSHLCLDDHQIKKEELENKGELSEVCSHIVLKCLYLARIGRPDILWSVNKMARLVLFQDSDFAGDLEDPKSTSRGVCAFWGVDCARLVGFGY